MAMGEDDDHALVAKRASIRTKVCSQRPSSADMSGLKEKHPAPMPTVIRSRNSLLWTSIKDTVSKCSETESGIVMRASSIVEVNFQQADIVPNWG
jgi:hypothetical protein